MLVLQTFDAKPGIEVAEGSVRTGIVGVTRVIGLAGAAESEEEEERGSDERSGSHFVSKPDPNEALLCPDPDR